MHFDQRLRVLDFHPVGHPAFTAVPVEGQTHNPTSLRRKLPQPDATLLQHPRRLAVHVVALRIHHLLDPDLHNLDTARQTRTRITVEDAARVSDALPARLEQGVLFRVEAEARVQASRGAAVAAGTAALVAVGEVSRGAVVAGGDDAVVADEHGADAAFHAVGAGRGKGGEAHEVLVPGRAEAGGGGQVQGLQVRV